LDDDELTPEKVREILLPDTIKEAEPESSPSPFYRNESWAKSPENKARLQLLSLKAGQGVVEARKKKENLCGAAKHDGSGRTCRNWAGYKTDHAGEGFCYLHGGTSTGVVGWPKSLALVAERYHKDPDMLSLTREIAIARARIFQMEDQAQVDERNPKQDFTLARYLDLVRKLVETQFVMNEKKKYTVTIDALIATVVKCADIVMDLLVDETLRQQALARFSEVIMLPPDQSQKKLRLTEAEEEATPGEYIELEDGSMGSFEPETEA
jgi:hypothetical protein